MRAITKDISTKRNQQVSPQKFERDEVHLIIHKQTYTCSKSTTIETPEKRVMKYVPN